MHFSGFFCCYSVSRCSNKPTIKIIDWSFLCRQANVQNQCHAMDYSVCVLFSFLCVPCAFWSSFPSCPYMVFLFLFPDCVQFDYRCLVFPSFSCVLKECFVLRSLFGVCGHTLLHCVILFCFWLKSVYCEDYLLVPSYAPWQSAGDQIIFPPHCKLKILI